MSAAPPKAVPTGPVIGAHHRVRHDTIDTGGTVTLYAGFGIRSAWTSQSSPAVS
jgi:hypothetical protein